MLGKVAFLVIQPDGVIPLGGPAALQMVDQPHGDSPSPFGIVGEDGGGVHGFLSAFQMILQGKLVNPEHIGNFRRVFGVVAGTIAVVQMNGLHLLRIGNPAFDTQRIDLDGVQAQSQSRSQQSQPQKVHRLEHPGAPAQEHQGGEPSGHQSGSHHHPAIGLIAKEDGEHRVEAGGAQQGKDNQEHRSQLPAGQEISGAFQLTAAVEHQRQHQQHCADGGQNGQIDPSFRGHGEAAHTFVLIGVFPLHIGSGIVHIRQLCHGAEPIEGSQRGDHTQKQGGVQAVNQEKGQHGAEVEHSVEHCGGEAAAAEHDAENRKAEEEQVLQVGAHPPESRQLPCVHHHAVGVQQHPGNHRHHGGGNQREQQSGLEVGSIEGAPFHRHGVQGVAHPAVEQIPEQHQRGKERIACVDGGHGFDQRGHAVSQPIFRGIVRGQHEQPQQQAHQIHSPQGSKPGEVFAQQGALRG